MPYLDGFIYRELIDRKGLFVNFRQNSYLVSETEFNRFTNQSIDLAPDELLIVTNDADAAKEGTSFNTVIVVEPFVQGMTRATAFRQEELSMDMFIKTLDTVNILEYTQEKTEMMFLPFVNSNGYAHLYSVTKRFSINRISKPIYVSF